MASLTGKVAIVTGSSRGIGRAIAERFAADGASVVVNYARSADEARGVVAGIGAKGGKAIAIQADFGIVADVRRLFRDTIAKFGHVDIVVNNAWAVARGIPKAFAEITDDEFDASFTHNARGSFFMMQEAARTISDRGRIINVTTSGTTVCPPGFSIYVGGKCAMEAFSTTLAAELAPRRITVNIVSSGAVETKMLRDLPEDWQTALVGRTPLGVGQPRDIAGMVAFLVSEEGHWITNEKIRVDGGIR